MIDETLVELTDPGRIANALTWCLLQPADSNVLQLMALHDGKMEVNYKPPPREEDGSPSKKKKKQKRVSRPWSVGLVAWHSLVCLAGWHCLH